MVNAPHHKEQEKAAVLLHFIFLVASESRCRISISRQEYRRRAASTIRYQNTSASAAAFGRAFSSQNLQAAAEELLEEERALGQLLQELSKRLATLRNAL